MIDDTEIRATALNIANHTFRESSTPEQVVAAAKIYYSFLSGIDKPVEEPAPPKVGRPKKAAVPPAEEPNLKSEAATPTSSVSASPTEKPPGYDEVRAVLVDVQSKFDRKKAQALLDKWAGPGGVISKVPEGDRAKLIAEGKALVS